MGKKSNIKLELVVYMKNWPRAVCLTSFPYEITQEINWIEYVTNASRFLFWKKKLKKSCHCTTCICLLSYLIPTLHFLTFLREKQTNPNMCTPHKECAPLPQHTQTHRGRGSIKNRDDREPIMSASELETELQFRSWRIIIKVFVSCIKPISSAEDKKEKQNQLLFVRLSD